MDGISVPENAVSEANPLLVVNGRVNLTKMDATSLQPGRIAAIEANHMVATGRVNTRVGL